MALLQFVHCVLKLLQIFKIMLMISTNTTKVLYVNTFSAQIHINIIYFIVLVRRLSAYSHETNFRG